MWFPFGGDEGELSRAPISKQKQQANRGTGLSPDYAETTWSFERSASKRRKCLLRHYNVSAFRKLPVTGGGPATLFTC
jgi:hypothetical protein